MAKPGSDQDGAMVEKTNGKKSKEKISPFVKTPKTEILGKEGRCKTLKRKLSFTVSPPRNEERGSDTDDTDPGQSSHAWGERLHTPCRIYGDKDGPDKKKMKKEAGPKKSTPVNILFGYPLSERKQMALLMQMTARDNSPDSTPSHPSQASAGQKKITSSSSSRQKDKVNKRNERGETPLHLAAIRGDVKHVKELIGLGADVNIKDFAGWTPLHEACNLGYYDVAKVLIGAGAEVNTQGLDDDTPLHDATSSGYKNIMKLLLRNGGNAFQANKRGERPVDVAESKDLEHLLKGEIPLSEVEESSSESEDPTSVNQSSGDENMEYSDTDKDSDNKSVTVKASSSMSGLDEYEFKDEEEEEDISKALNERNILRRDLRQKEKETERNQFTSKQGKQSDQYRCKPKKSKSSLIYGSSESSSDESEFQAEKNVDCHKADSRLKHENLNNMPGEQKEKNKQKKKTKSQSKNKENQGVQEGKEKSISTTTVSEMADKGSREEDSFKMSFSAKDETSVHLFHLSVVKNPKLNQSQTEKQATPLKQDNTKTSVSVSDGSCSLDGIKHSHYIESDYSTEGSSNRNSKHKQKNKHHLNELSDDGSSSPFKDGSLNTSIDSSESLVRKTDKEGKGVKKHKLNHKEKEKCRKEYEAKNMRSLQKEARKDRHRNLEFDREFWKENFFKSDEKEEAVNKREVSPVKEERKIKDKHSCTSSNSKERRTKSEWERDKSLKREKKDFFVKGKDWKGDAFNERTETPGSGSFLDSFSHRLVVKDEPDHKSITGSIVDQDQMSSEKIPQEKNEKQPSTRERESDKCEKKYADKDKKIKNENLTDKSEMPNYIDRWNEKEKLAGASELPIDKSHKDTDKLKGTSSLKKHEDGRKNKDKRPDREHSSDHREKDKTNAEKRAKILEKPSDSLKSERFKEKEREKDCDKRKKEKTKENITSSSTFSSLKLLLEEKKKHGSENSKTSYKLKDDLNKPVEKDRERRDREREPERLRDWRERERHKEKDRDRSKIEINRDGKINKIKSSEVESKMKIATVLKDTRPKEKRLVNDDLMKTSFERMLSLKDQEFEQWHRKHLEKIKQKEKERLKQRPGLDCGKPKSKERLKTGFSPSEHSIPKELMRSKSSETSDLQREKVVKEATSIRALSLEGKNSKINTSSENSFTISPKIEKEKSGLISRSMSMISMMSSEDSCQAVALTPRAVEYDSDMNMDFSGSQPPSLQQSSISPSCHNKDGVTPPDTMLCSQTPLSSRPTSQSLRSILDEDSKMTAAETKHAEISQQICTEPLSNVDQTTAHLVGNAVIQPFVALSGSESPTGKKALETLACQTQPSLQMQESCSKEVQEPDNIIQAHSAMQLHSEEGKAVATLANQTTKDSSLESAASIPVNVCEPSSSQNWESHMDEQAATEDPELKKILLIEENLVNLTDTSGISLEGSSEETSFRDDVEKLDACTQEDNASGLFNESLVDALVDKHDLVNHPTLKTNISCCASPEKIQEELTVDKHSLAEECLNKIRGEEMNDMKDVSFDKSLTGTHTLPENSDQSEVAEEKFANSDIHVRDAEDVTNPLYNFQGELQNEVTSASSSPLSVTERDSDFSGTRSKVQLLEDEFYLQATHPRKRKMQRVSALAQTNITALHVTESTQESLAAIVDGLKLEEIEPYETERANPYYDYLHIRKKIEAKRKVLCNVIPQAPQYYDEYVTFNGSYLLDGNPLSKLCIPTITPPPSLPDALKEMFKQQELVRMKLRLQHSIEREKLIVSNEQEVLRVHYRAARTLANQTLPFSACTVLLDAEVYNMPTDVQSEDGKASVRDRFNARQFMSWLQDVDDKFDKLKTCLLMRQQHEAAALNAVQRLEWQLKLQELDPASYKATSIFEIPEFYIPLVEVNDDFDLTPI